MPQVNEIFWSLIFLFLVFSFLQIYMFFSFFLNFSFSNKIFMKFFLFSEF